MAVVGTSHYLPSITMVINVPAPGQRLKPDAYAPRLRPFT